MGSPGAANQKIITLNQDGTMTLFSIAHGLYHKSIKKDIDESDLDAVITWPEDSLSVLFACADQVRRHFFNNTVNPCALLNIKSGNCSEDCAFCSQSSHNTAEIPRHELVHPEEIVKKFIAARAANLDFCVVSSGRKLSIEEIRTVAGALRTVGGPSHASLGILTDEEFGILRDAGVVCYNHNLETSRNFFSAVCTTHGYDDRIATIKKAKKAGIKVCCGGIFGLGESWNDRKDLCRELQRLDVDTVPLNFLNPIPGTRVRPPKESAMEFLKIVSLFRLALPDKTIKVCGGREHHLGPLQPLIFYAGANGYVSGGYLTTAGIGVDADDAMIKAMGLRKKEK
jgi:biotin synthase